ncbi:hypothetical protein GALMADRAFT_144318 [Galerina marginata CBS 339.88]|uniref:F-box domain-containing protein n=1 Tax=Galerina marginata (strain CBS 339.88) TaxID=685588 RepID=A0A067SLD3_GALM3|nr:hypothetical protein GALMADRAFT_144318 [Galerina marginata CBS 339.88]
MPLLEIIPFTTTSATPSKVYSFPPEILGQIFEECLLPLHQRLAFSQPSSPVKSGNDDHSSIRAPMPMTLCHICSYWRNTAFSTPQLWNYLFHTAVVRELDTELSTEWNDGIDTDSNAITSYDNGGDYDYSKPISLPRPLPLQKSINICKKDLDFLRWWAEKVRGNSLALRLRFRTELVAPSAVGDIITLGDYLQNELISADSAEGDISFLPDLISRARYLDVDPQYHSILADRPLLLSATLLDTYPTLHYSNLKSLVLDSNGADEEEMVVLDNHLWHVPFERMPELRKLCVVNCVLFDPFASLRPVAGGFGTTMWKKLTHLFLRLETTRAEWHRFLSECSALQKGHFLLDINIDSHPLPFGTGINSTVTVFPNLKELGLVLDDTNDDHCFPYLLDGALFPSLDALLLRGSCISLPGLHRLLGTTPQLKKLRLHLLFPSQDGYQRGTHLHSPSFPHPDNFEDGSLLRPASGIHASRTGSKLKALSYYVPHLELLMLDLPRIGPQTQTYIPYVQGMVESGWLDGFCVASASPCQKSQSSPSLPQSRATFGDITNSNSQSNSTTPSPVLVHPHPEPSVRGKGNERSFKLNPQTRALKLDLFWKWNIYDAPRMWPMITELKGFLQRTKTGYKSEGFNVQNDWCLGVDIGVKVKYDPRPAATEEDQEYWEMWFDHSFEF